MSDPSFERGACRRRCHCRKKRYIFYRTAWRRRPPKPLSSDRPKSHTGITTFEGGASRRSMTRQPQLRDLP